MSSQKSADEQAKRERNAKIENEYFFKGRKFKVRVDTITLDGGESYKREIVEHPGAVVMIPITSEGQLILVRQWRRAADKVLYELPAGTLEENEPPHITADRELQEEIGLKAGRMTALGGFYSAPGICTEYLYLYLAEDLSESWLDPDAHEEIEVCPVNMSQALAMIERGEIEDAKSIAGILRYYVRTNQPQA